MKSENSGDDNMNLKLISFTICPFVQRSVITLNYKKVKHDVEYIDLDNKPDWFLKLSPLGKVPVLVVNNKDVLFESAVINEYIDETNTPTTLSSDSLAKATERAWIEYASPILMLLFGIITGEEVDEEKIDMMFDKLAKLEDIIDGNGFFKGDSFSIVDSSYTPIFFRLQYFDKLFNDSRFTKLKKVHKWATNMLSQDYVQSSVPSSFKEDFKKYLEERDAAFAKELNY